MITLSEPGEYGPFTIDATSDDVGLLITSPGVVLRPGSRIKNARRHGILIRSRPGLDIAGIVLHSYEVVGSGGHGVHHEHGGGTISEVTHRKGRVFFCGHLEKAHGFTSTGGGQTISSWDYVDGTVYSARLVTVRAANTTRCVVQRSVGVDPVELVRDPALAVGSFDVRGNTLYVNLGRALDGVTVKTTSESTRGILYDSCVAVGVLNHSGTEGHGFAFDDWTRDSRAIDCISEWNHGYGFQVNGGDGNMLINVSAKNNCLDTTAYPVSYSVGALQFCRNICINGQIDQQIYISGTAHRVIRSSR